MNMADLQDTFCAEVRGIQSLYPQAHQALNNWGAWSRDRGVGPRMARQHILDQHDGDVEGYGEEGEELERVDSIARAERKEESYEEKPATILDERIHSPGGLSVDVRRALRAAYIDGGPVEARWPLYSGCAVPGHFLERLEAGLRFVRRFL